jgi:hypothetical protein
MNDTKHAILKQYDGAKWGMGIEHEVHYFHQPHVDSASKKKVDSIVVCDVSHAIQRIIEREEEAQKKGKSILREYMKKTRGIRMNPNEFVTLLKAVPQEKSGRMCSGKPALKRVPIFMPEFITRSGNEKDPFVTVKAKSKRRRTVEMFTNDIYTKEELIIQMIQELDPITKKRVKEYGPLTSYPTGMSSHIRVPKSYETNFKKEEGDTDLDVPYRFIKEADGSYKTYKDYTGSYHVTMTLPHHESMKQSTFIEIHKNFANTVQWIEPLLLSCFFSGDDRCFGTTKVYPRGSFRVMRVGWGNFAGSDVREFDKGIGRYAVIPAYWREGLEFDDMKELSYCDGLSESILRDSPRAVSSLSSDFRTFGSRDPKRPWHRESGLGMTKPNGIEIRIFDHFPYSGYDGQGKDLKRLILLLTYLAENSRVCPPTDYVYQNKAWIDTMHVLMKDGYRAIIPDSYVQTLRKQLGLSLTTKKRHAYEFFQELVDELVKKHSYGEWTTVMTSRPYKRILLPNYNFDSWLYSFLFYADKHPKQVESMMKFICKHLQHQHDTSGIILVKPLEQAFKKKYPKKYSLYFEDLMEFIGTLKKAHVIYPTRDTKGCIQTFVFGKNGYLLETFTLIQMIRYYLLTKLNTSTHTLTMSKNENTNKHIM